MSTDPTSPDGANPNPPAPAPITDPNPPVPPASVAPPAPPPPATPPAPAQLARPVPGAMAGNREVIVYRHSGLFYWWPVWSLGFLFALISYFMGETLAIVPSGSVAAEQRKVEVDRDGDLQTRDVIILKEGAKLRHDKVGEVTQVAQPRYYMVGNKTLGTIYVILLAMIISITNVPVRGLWSIMLMVSIVMISVMFALAGIWEIIFLRMGQLAIYINMGGYLFLSTVLVILWTLNFFIFDRQIYMIFTPGQVRVRVEIGGAETVYDTLGMVVQKTRSDIFRHWVLGFGSGDLIIRPAGLGYPLELLNVMNVAAKVKAIEQLVKERLVVQEKAKGKP